jgi:hypothetical protein
MAKALAWQVCDGLCPRIHLLSLGAQTLGPPGTPLTERTIIDVHADHQTGCIPAQAG